MKKGPFENEVGEIRGLFKMGMGWFLRSAAFIEFCFMLMIKPEALSWACQSRAFKSLTKSL